jgi:hypothetical protein
MTAAMTLARIMNHESFVSTGVSDGQARIDAPAPRVGGL